MDVGAPILRVVLGLLFIGHGTQKLFGWWHGGGLAGTSGMLEGGGFRPALPFAVATGLAEAGGGTLLLVGLLTPLGAAAVIGVMTVAIGAVHLPNGLWNTNRGYEFPLLICAVAAALAFAGPGRLSLDRAIGWHLAGPVWGILAVAVGLVSGLAVLGWRGFLRRRTSAGASEGSPERPPRAA
jgi:putative oxidoreductase